MGLRELAGWGLALGAYALPPAVLIALALWIDADAPVGVFLLLTLALLVAPALWLWAKRLREPAREDVAEADGRRPVLVLHAFSRARVPWYRRALVFTPGFLRDLADHRLERALDASLEHAGPVLHLARPAPAPDHGPLALDHGREEWERRLEERLKAARLVAIVLDGSDENRAEIERAAAICGTSRVILVPPPKIDPELIERWEATRRELPALPALDGRVAALRFDRAVNASALSAPYASFGARLKLLARPSMLLRDHERSPRPVAPGWSWILTGLPIVLSLAGLLILPAALREIGVGRPSNAIVGLSTTVVVCAVILAVLSRRSMRLVPSSELPMVLVASLPWWASELAGWLMTHDGGGLEGWLRASSLGAAYSIPLLVSCALVLAGASLMRRSPGRRPSFAAFGLAALIPFAALYASLFSHTDDLLVAFFGLAPVGFALAIATVSASGDAGRRHAPLSIGSASSAALAAAAIGCTALHDTWRDMLLGTNDSVDFALEAGAEAARLHTITVAWPWFALAIPALVVLVAAQFRGRASRTATANVLALLPLLLVVGLATGADASAAARVASARELIGGEALRRAGGDAVDPALDLPAVEGAPRSPGVVDVVLDRGGALAAGRRVASAVDLATPGSVAEPVVARAVAEPVASTGAVRIAADRRASADALAGAVQAAFAGGAGEVQLVVVDRSGALASIRLERSAPGLGAEPGVVLRVGHRGARLLGAGWEPTEVPDGPDGHLGGALADQLRIRRAQRPDQRPARLVPEPGLTVDRLVEAAAVARSVYPRLTLARAR